MRHSSEIRVDLPHLQAREPGWGCLPIELQELLQNLLTKAERGAVPGGTDQQALHATANARDDSMVEERQQD